MRQCRTAPAERTRACVESSACAAGSRRHTYQRPRNEGMCIRAALPPPQLCWISLASLCWAFVFGVGAPLASVWLQDVGHSTTVICLNTCVYYLSIELTA